MLQHTHSPLSVNVQTIKDMIWPVTSRYHSHYWLWTSPIWTTGLSIICPHSLERHTLVRLKPHITSSPNFCPLQSAYPQLHSTEIAVIKIVDDVLAETDWGPAVTVNGLDVVSIWHHTLSDRFESNFGIACTYLQWTTSYLSEHSSWIHVNSTSSESVTTHFGVPQRSILGPVLFTAYMAPVGRLIGHTGNDFNQYADDINIYTSLSPSSADLTQLTWCNSSPQHWLWHNGVLLNPDKSCHCPYLSDPSTKIFHN